LSPLGQRCGAVLLEGVTAVQVTVLTEVIVDGGVDGGELLKSLGALEFCHCLRPARRAGGRGWGP